MGERIQQHSMFRQLLSFSGGLQRLFTRLFLFGLPGWEQGSSQAPGNLYDPTDLEQGSVDRHGVNGSLANATMGTDRFKQHDPAWPDTHDNTQLGIAHFLT